MPADFISGLRRICFTTSIITSILSISTFAEPISVSGTVVDTLGNPISGAVVQLKAQRLADTTGADGVFSFSGITAIRNQTAQFTGSSFIGNRLALNITSRQHVAVDIFNAKGALISQAYDKVLDAGSHSIVVPTAELGVGMLFVRVTTGAVQQTFKMVSNGNGKISGAGVVPARRAEGGAVAVVEAAAVDSLLCARYAYVTVSAALESFAATGVVITLKARRTKPYEFVSIPGGTFNMGADSISQTPGTCNLQGDTIHTVTLSPFMMQATEVTQEQYLAVMGTNPAYFNTDLSNPIENVSWYDAVRFCNALSIISGLPTVYYMKSEFDSTTWKADMSKKGYRLPTEAEWEFACKANSTTNFYWGNGSDSATICANSWNVYNSDYSTHPVATKAANNYGLYDMSGNVWEWCGDLYAAYHSAAATDPTGPAFAAIPYNGARMDRGEAFGNNGPNLRLTLRGFYYPYFKSSNGGFRVVLSH